LSHTEDSAVEIDVLAPAQLRVKASAHLQKRAYAPIDLGAPRGWPRDTRQQLQQGALAGAVASDNPQYLTAWHVEGNIAKGPEFLRAVSAPAPGCSDSGDNRLAQRAVGGRPPVEPVSLAQALDADGDSSHRSDEICELILCVVEVQQAA